MLALYLLACTTNSDGVWDTGFFGETGDTAEPLGALGLDAELGAAVKQNDGFGGGILRAAAPGELRFEGAHGDATAGGDPIQATDNFEIASITKTITATTVLLLTEAGDLSLDETLAEALPEYSENLLVIDGTDLTATITLRQLLNHTSGLPDYWTDPPFVQPSTNAFLSEFLADPDHFWTPEEILVYVPDLTPIARPGKKWHYSDTNYVLLGLIVERATGQELHDAMRDRIFDPVGMDDTWMSFREDRPTPTSHRYEGEWDMTTKTNQSADWAGGGLVSTAQDLAEFMFALSGEEILSEASLDEMHTEVETGSAGITYGLGIFIVALDDGSTVWGHDGYGNSFAYIHDADDTVFTGTLNQTENDWWPMVEAGL